MKKTLFISRSWGLLHYFLEIPLHLLRPPRLLNVLHSRVFRVLRVHIMQIYIFSNAGSMSITNISLKENNYSCYI